MEMPDYTNCAYILTTEHMEKWCAEHHAQVCAKPWVWIGSVIRRYAKIKKRRVTKTMMCPHQK